MNRFAGRRAVLVSKHEKERAIAPVLAELGIELEVEAIDTDAFGTFTGEVARTGTPLDAARRKIEAGAARRPDVDLFVASEGSFGPHPLVLSAADHELVLLVDRNATLELTGETVTIETNHGAHTARSVADVERIARAIGLPEHGAIVRRRERIEKGITSVKQLRRVIASELETSDAVVIEADLRAMFNPTRMHAIAEAAKQLVAAARSECPECGRPGFVTRDVRRGVPCVACGTPTSLIAAEIARCTGCGATREQPRDVAEADPQWCDACNP